MSDPIFQALYRLSESELDSANARHTRHQWRWLVWVSVGLVVLNLLLIVMLDGPDWNAIVQSLDWVLFYGLGLLIGYLGLRRRWRAAYRNGAALSREYKLSLFDESFLIEHFRGSERYDWNEMLKWDLSSEMLLVYPTSNCFFPFPRRDIGEDAISFAVGRLKAQGLSQPNRKRRN